MATKKNTTVKGNQAQENKKNLENATKGENIKLSYKGANFVCGAKYDTISDTFLVNPKTSDSILVIKENAKNGYCFVKAYPKAKKDSKIYDYKKALNSKTHALVESCFDRYTRDVKFAEVKALWCESKAVKTIGSKYTYVFRNPITHEEMGSEEREVVLSEIETEIVAKAKRDCPKADIVLETEELAKAM